MRTLRPDARPTLRCVGSGVMAIRAIALVLLVLVLLLVPAMLLILVKPPYSPSTRSAATVPTRLPSRAIGRSPYVVSPVPAFPAIVWKVWKVWKTVCRLPSEVLM